ncbi:MAG: hypothetical protein A2V67_17695 [Deltaproteobacteria bacterium RBG_13_61_14]|nr:MAG: hypothetical protein A2V67_17695 [Deltaproteobacteria bacterium RBG_13_61_14]
MRPLRLWLVMVLGFAAVPCTPSREPGPLLIWLIVSPEQEKVMQGVAKEFESRHSIPTRLEAKSPEQIESWLASGQKGEPRPDLVDVDISRLPDFAATVQDLEPLMKKWNPPSLLYAAWAPGTFSDRLFFLPWHLSWSAMICNGSVLPEPPRTWNELLAVAGEHPGGVALRGLRPESLAQDLVPLIGQAGGDPYDFTDPGTIKAFEFLGRLGPLLNLSTRSFTEESILAAQSQGEVILHFNNLKRAQILAHQKLLPFPNYTAILPEGPEGVAGRLEGNYLGIPKTAPHPRDAYLFLQFLLEPKIQTRLFDELGWLSPLADTKNLLGEFDQERYQGFLQMASAVNALPPAKHLPEVQELWARAFAEVVYQGAPAQEVLARLAPEMKRLLGVRAKL